MTKADLAQYIDHTLLKADATEKQLMTLFSEAKRFKFYSVCVHPCWISAAAENLRETLVLPITVVGFPLGANVSSVKVEETRIAIAAGAREIDMVINVGHAKSENWDLVEKDIREVVTAARTTPVKAILETCYLSDTQIVQAAILAKTAGAAFVKTSTGFGSAGATRDHIRILRQTVGPSMGVKASGGVRTYEDAVAMIRAGANRIGTSNSVAIVEANLKTDMSLQN